MALSKYQINKTDIWWIEVYEPTPTSQKIYFNDKKEAYRRYEKIESCSLWEGRLDNSIQKRDLIIKLLTNRNDIRVVLLNYSKKLEK